MTRVLGRLLEIWSSLSQAFYKQTKTTCPLDPYKDEILQLYSIMSPLCDIIVSCQDGKKPMGGAGLIDLVTLRTGNFNVLQNCEIPLRNPDDIEAYKKTLKAREEFDMDIFETTLQKVKYSEMRPIAQKTLKKLVDALDRRFFWKRYGRPAWGATPPEGISYLFDMSLYVNPAYRELWYVPSIVKALGGTDANVTTVTNHIMGAVKKVLMHIATAEEELRSDQSHSATTGEQTQGNVHAGSPVRLSARYAHMVSADRAHAPATTNATTNTAPTLTPLAWAETVSVVLVRNALSLSLSLSVPSSEKKIITNMMQLSINRQ